MPVSHRTFNTICKYIGVDPDKAPHRSGVMDRQSQGMGEVGDSIIHGKKEFEVRKISSSMATSAVPFEYARYSHYLTSL